MASSSDENSLDTEDQLVAMYMPVPEMKDAELLEKEAPEEGEIGVAAEEQPGRKRRRSSGLPRYFDKDAAEEAIKGPLCYNCQKVVTSHL